MMAVHCALDIICQNCGDKGYLEQLITCRKCRFHAIHRYCLDRLPKPDDVVTWSCEECSHPGTSSLASNKVNTETSKQAKGEEQMKSAPFEEGIAKHAQIWLQPSREQSDGVKKTCLESFSGDTVKGAQRLDQCRKKDKVVTEGYGPSSGDVLKLVKKKDAFMTSSDGDTRKSEEMSEPCKGNIGDLRWSESCYKKVVEKAAFSKSNEQEVKKMCTSSDVELVENMMGNKRKFGLVDAESGVEEHLNFGNICKDEIPPGKLIAEETRSSSEPCGKEIKREARDHSEFKGKGSLLPIEFSSAQDLKRRHCHLSCDGRRFLSVNIEEKNDSANAVHGNEKYGYAYSQPIFNAVWRGTFDIGHQKCGVKAHLSNKACSKVHGSVNVLESRIYLEKIRRADAWPQRFNMIPPSDDNIALFFFTETELDDIVFDELVKEINTDDLALRALFDQAELLVFSSLLLPLNYWKFSGKYYLWGLFKGIKRPISSNGNRQSKLFMSTGVADSSDGAVSARSPGRYEGVPWLERCEGNPGTVCVSNLNPATMELSKDLQKIVGAPTAVNSTYCGGKGSVKNISAPFMSESGLTITDKKNSSDKGETEKLNLEFGLSLPTIKDQGNINNGCMISVSSKELQCMMPSQLKNASVLSKQGCQQPRLGVVNCILSSDNRDYEKPYKGSTNNVYCDDVPVSEIIDAKPIPKHKQERMCQNKAGSISVCRPKNEDVSEAKNEFVQNHIDSEKCYTELPRVMAECKCASGSDSEADNGKLDGCRSQRMVLSPLSDVFGKIPPPHKQHGIYDSQTHLKKVPSQDVDKIITMRVSSECQLLKEFKTAKMVKGTSVKAHLLKMMKFLDKLQNFGIFFSSNTIKNDILNSLPLDLQHQIPVYFMCEEYTLPDLLRYLEKAEEKFSGGVEPVGDLK